MKKSLLTIFFLPIFLVTFSQQQDSLALRDSSTFNRERKMESVTVTAKKTFVEMKADKTILNVSGNITLAGANGLEVLQQAPGVSVTGDEVISLAGKQGVLVMVDGLPVQLSGKDLSVYLKSLPAAMIDKVEIITNPSSRYDAQGDAGIINIRLKKNTSRSTSFNFGFTYTQAVHANADANAGLNWRKRKWSGYVKLTGRKWQQHTDGSLWRQVNYAGITHVFSNTTIDEDASANLNFLTGIDYAINKKHSIGFLAAGNFYNSRLYTPGNTLVTTPAQADSSLETINDSRQRTQRGNYNLNYRYADTTGREFSIDADYGRYHNKNNGAVNMDFYGSSGPAYANKFTGQQVITAIDVISLKSDLTVPIKKLHARLEAGLKWNYTHTANDLVANKLNNNLLVADTGRTNRFRYSENITAAYASFNREFKKWEWQLGLRAEQSVIKGHSIDLLGKAADYPDSSYLSLFPAFFIRYGMNENNSLRLAGSRRINRPSYQDLNPFEYIYDNYSKERGNAYLLPEFTNNIEWSYNHKGVLNLAMGYSNTSHAVKNVSWQDSLVTYTSVFNIGREERWYLDAGWSVSPAKWWDIYISCTPHYKHFRGQLPEGLLDNSAWGMNWYWNQAFTLPAGWKIQLSSWGNTGTREGMARNHWLGSWDAGISKQFLKGKGSLRLAVTDIFNTQQWRQEISFGKIQSNYRRKWESRTVRLQVSLSLGNRKIKVQERTSGASAELERIK